MIAIRPTSPVVSVVMSVFNGASFLAEAIESILGQSYDEFEFIIINDGSTDASQQIIDSYDDCRISVVQQERHGLTWSLNKGLKMARGQFIARQDADDISLSTRLEKQVGILDTHPDVALVGTGVTVIDSSGQGVRGFIYPSDHKRLIKRLYRTGNPLPHSTIMFRRDVVSRLGGYHDLFIKSQDLDMILRIIEKYKVYSVPEELVKLRCRTDSVSLNDNSAEQSK